MQLHFVSKFTEIRSSAVSPSKPERVKLADLLLGSLDGAHDWEMNIRDSLIGCSSQHHHPSKKPL
jgi:hypothetical protein